MRATLMSTAPPSFSPCSFSSHMDTLTRACQSVPWTRDHMLNSVNVCINLPLIQPLMHVQIGLTTSSVGTTTQHKRHHIIHQWICAACSHSCLHRTSFGVKERRVDEVRVLVTPSPPLEPFLCECGCDTHAVTSHYIHSLASSDSMDSCGKSLSLQSSSLSSSMSLPLSLSTSSSPAPSSLSAIPLLHYAKQRATRWRLGYIDIAAENVYIRNPGHEKWNIRDICGIPTLSQDQTRGLSKTPSSAATGTNGGHVGVEPAEHTGAGIDTPDSEVIDALRDAVERVWGGVVEKEEDVEESGAEVEGDEEGICVSVCTQDVEGVKEEEQEFSSSDFQRLPSDLQSSLWDVEHYESSLIASVMCVAKNITRVHMPEVLRPTLKMKGWEKNNSGSGEISELGVREGLWENMLVTFGHQNEANGATLEKHIGKIFIEFRNCIPPGAWDSAWLWWNATPDTINTHVSADVVDAVGVREVAQQAVAKPQINSEGSREHAATQEREKKVDEDWGGRVEHVCAGHISTWTTSTHLPIFSTSTTSTSACSASTTPPSSCPSSSLCSSRATSSCLSSLAAYSNPFSLAACENALRMINTAAVEHSEAYRGDMIAGALKIMPVRRILREVLREVIRESRPVARNTEKPVTEIREGDKPEEEQLVAEDGGTHEEDRSELGCEGSEEKETLPAAPLALSSPKGANRASLSAQSSSLHTCTPTHADAHLHIHMQAFTHLTSVFHQLFGKTVLLRFIRALLRWCKDRFTWVNAPTCCLCGGETQAVGAVAPLPSEAQYGAHYAELYRCRHHHSTRFPRYNHPLRCLQAARGRCGEYNQAWGLVVRAAGVWAWSVARQWAELMLTTTMNGIKEKRETMVNGITVCNFSAPSSSSLVSSSFSCHSSSMASTTSSATLSPHYQHLLALLMRSAATVSARTVHDVTDHVWTEVAVVDGHSANTDTEITAVVNSYSTQAETEVEEGHSSLTSSSTLAHPPSLPPALVCYTHTDACENAIGEPLLYSKGWGKQLREVWCVGVGGVECGGDRYCADVREARLRQSLHPWAAAALLTMLHGHARVIEGVALVYSHPLARLSRAISTYRAAQPIAAALTRLATHPSTPLSPLPSTNSPTRSESGNPRPTSEISREDPDSGIPSVAYMREVLLAGLVSEVLMCAREVLLWTHVFNNVYAVTAAETRDVEEVIIGATGVGSEADGKATRAKDRTMPDRAEIDGDAEDHEEAAAETNKETGECVRECIRHGGAQCERTREYGYRHACDEGDELNGRYWGVFHHRYNCLCGMGGEITSNHNMNPEKHPEINICAAITRAKKLANVLDAGIGIVHANTSTNHTYFGKINGPSLKNLEFSQCASEFTPECVLYGSNLTDRYVARIFSTGLRGRTTGSVEWRRARQEDGSSPQ